MGDDTQNTSLLKGNFTPRQKVYLEPDSTLDSSEEFERKAIAKLGGSICFVRKKAFVLDPEQSRQDNSNG